MSDRRRLRAALLVPVLAAALALPAGAAPGPGKASHYPGQDCTKCHKVRPKPGEKMPPRPAGSPARTGTTSPAPAAPSQGAPRSR